MFSPRRFSHKSKLTQEIALEFKALTKSSRSNFSRNATLSLLNDSFHLVDCSSYAKTMSAIFTTYFSSSGVPRMPETVSSFTSFRHYLLEGCRVERCAVFF